MLESVFKTTLKDSEDFHTVLDVKLSRLACAHGTVEKSLFAASKNVMTVENRSGRLELAPPEPNTHCNL